MSRRAPTDLKATNAILDGEIVCVDDQGRSQFYDLMFHRGEPYFYATLILCCERCCLLGRRLAPIS